jgi:hypothetical protein
MIMKDFILNIIENVSSQIHTWAWNKKRKDTPQKKWIKGYKKWKDECPHN